MFGTGKAKYDCHSIVWLKANISSQPSHTFSPITTNFSNPVSQWSWGKACDRSLKTHGSVDCCWTFFCTQRALSPPLSLHLRVISIISLKSLWLQPQWSAPADGGGQKNPNPLVCADHYVPLEHRGVVDISQTGHCVLLFPGWDQLNACMSDDRDSLWFYIYLYLHHPYWRICMRKSISSGNKNKSLTIKRWQRVILIFLPGQSTGGLSLTLDVARLMYSASCWWK